MTRLLFLVFAIAAPAVAQETATGQTSTQARAADGRPPQRIRNVQLQQGQACPRGNSDEIVVCDTITEPYRIPKQFRDEGPVPAQNQSWVNRTATIDQVSRVASGLPDTCSPVGTGGQSGCALQQNRVWAAEKRAQARAAESVPGGQ